MTYRDHHEHAMQQTLVVMKRHIQASVDNVLRLGAVAKQQKTKGSTLIANTGEAARCGEKEHQSKYLAEIERELGSMLYIADLSTARASTESFPPIAAYCLSLLVEVTDRSETHAALSATLFELSLPALCAKWVHQMMEALHRLQPPDTEATLHSLAFTLRLLGNLVACRDKRLNDQCSDAGILEVTCRVITQYGGGMPGVESTTREVLKQASRLLGNACFGSSSRNDGPQRCKQLLMDYVVAANNVQESVMGTLLHMIANCPRDVVLCRWACHAINEFSYGQAPNPRQKLLVSKPLMAHIALSKFVLGVMANYPIRDCAASQIDLDRARSVLTCLRVAVDAINNLMFRLPVAFHDVEMLPPTFDSLEAVVATTHKYLRTGACPGTMCDLKEGSDVDEQQAGIPPAITPLCGRLEKSLVVLTTTLRDTGTLIK